MNACSINNDESLYTNLEEAIKTVSKTPPKKPKVQPGWFQMAEPNPLPLIEKQNAAVKACYIRRG